jgi:homocysteine S-methyltransferase
MGPNHVLNALDKMRPLTTKKLSAQPNAGLPRDVQGRQMYMCSPEYMAEFSRRFIQVGASFIGGCCGTTPAHIRAIAQVAAGKPPRKIPAARRQTLLAGLEPMVIAA